MVIKVATERDQHGKIHWQTLYAASIQNRLRIDNNLSDLSDKAAARRNLGLMDTGTSATIDANSVVTTANNYTDGQVENVNKTIKKINTDISHIQAAIIALGGTIES